MTWRSENGKYSFYKNGKNVGNGTISKSCGKEIQSGGRWVLRQDQDTCGDGFDAEQSATGEFTGVNIWNRVLCPIEIEKMSRSCKASEQIGIVKSWNDFIAGVKGNVKTAKATCCQ